MMKIRFLSSLILSAALAFAPAYSLAEEATLPVQTAEVSVPVVNDVGLDLMGCSVHYPQLTGLAHEAVQTAVNNAIMEAGQIEARLNRMAGLMNSPVKLSVSYSWTLEGDIFSCALLADGAVETNRATQVWSAVNIDLTTGEAVTFGDLFADPEAAVSFMETCLEEQVMPELSAHLAAGSLTPLPHTFTITPAGLTLHYDIRSFRTLSDRAGTVTILWNELREHLKTEPGSILARLGADQHLTLSADASQRITASLAEGAFPGIPTAIGQPMQELIDRHALLTDPDVYEGGRMIALEDGAFRQVWLLTDGLRESFEGSIVQSIRADRLNLHGLCTGTTTIDQWRAALGEPEATLAVDEERAVLWRIVPGASDYYTFGSYRLRLHADESGVLRSVFLTN